MKALFSPGLEPAQDFAALLSSGGNLFAPVHVYSTELASSPLMFILTNPEEASAPQSAVANFKHASGVK